MATVQAQKFPVQMFDQYTIDKDILRIGLFRFALTDQYTMGFMYMNGEPFCFTLEDRVRDVNHDGDLNDPGEGKVYGDTAIPCGTYKITLYDSPHFKRMLPLLHNVEGFEGILIHGGNTVVDTKGCILVARNANILSSLILNGKNVGKIQGSTEQDVVRMIGKYKETYIDIKDGQAKSGIELTVSA